MLQIVCSKLHVANCMMQIACDKLHVTNCKWQIACCKLHVAIACFNCILQIACYNCMLQIACLNFYKNAHMHPHMYACTYLRASCDAVAAIYLHKAVCLWVCLSVMLFLNQAISQLIEEAKSLIVLVNFEIKVKDN